MIAYYDVCGTPTLNEIRALLDGGGYRESADTPAAPGEYRCRIWDAAPGWGDWMYEIAIWELEEQPYLRLIKEVR
ncbi:MAG TPA: hypothetical protein VGE07_09305 [Herpetosiphonaceae bacterium]